MLLPGRSLRRLAIPLTTMVLCAISSSATATPPVQESDDERVTYLNEALDILQTSALHRDDVDWDALRPTWIERAGATENMSEVHGILREAIRALQDGHSFLLTPDRAAAWRGDAKPTPETASPAAAPKPAVPTDPWPKITGRLIDDEFGYVVVPPCGSGNPDLLTAYADRLYSTIAALEEAAPIGWIVDLRGNGGGNCWPMLAGLSSLLGEGVVGGFATNDAASWYGVSPGRAWLTESLPRPVDLDRRRAAERNDLCKVSEEGSAFEEPAFVAVLTDERTASSGEVITVAFRERPQTRSFGRPTAGLSTANANFDLSDGAILFLTTSVYADRTGELYGKRITPDTPIEVTDSNDENDPDMPAAMEWLLTAWEQG